MQHRGCRRVRQFSALPMLRRVIAAASKIARWGARRGRLPMPLERPDSAAHKRPLAVAAFISPRGQKLMLLLTRRHCGARPAGATPAAAGACATPQAPKTRRRHPRHSDRTDGRAPGMDHSALPGWPGIAAPSGHGGVLEEQAPAGSLRSLPGFFTGQPPPEPGRCRRARSPGQRHSALGSSHRSADLSTGPVPGSESAA